MDYEVKVLADSLSPDGVRLTTLQCRYPRFIHSEMLRHRMFSHSVASSRAIPTEKQIARVREDPFVPATFNKRVKGMGVGEAMDTDAQSTCRHAWIAASKAAANHAEILNDLGIDKSRANRLLEPFIWVDDIITATEWDNFFALRDHPAAQPEFQTLAKMMREALAFNDPLHVNYGEWHLPLVSDFPWDSFDGDWDKWKRISASRCARISFDTHEQYEPHERSLERAAMLIDSGHLSPFEHVARPIIDIDEGAAVSGHDPSGGGRQHMFFGNFRGWFQFRKEFLHEDNFGNLIIKTEAR